MALVTWGGTQVTWDGVNVEWQPNIPSAPFARYRASGLTPGAISTWPDEGYGGNDLAQATGTNQPTAEAAGFNDHPSVLFDGALGGSGDWMQTAAYAAALAQPNTIIIMGEVVSNDSTVRYWFDSAVSSARHAVLDEADNIFDLFAGTATVNGPASPTAGLDVCAVFVFNGASSLVYLNGSSTGVGSTPGSNNLNGFTLLARFNGLAVANPAHMRIVEVLIYDRELTAAEVAALQDYFDATYAPPAVVTADVEHGIVLGHQVAGTVEEETVTAAVEHGIVLGHQVAAQSVVEGSVEHGIILGHQVAGQVIGGATIRHGLIFGHEVEFEIRVPVDMAVEHGIVFGHEAVFDVEREITTRPIQPMAKLRPLQPMFTSTP